MKNALRLPADRVHSYTTSWDVTGFQRPYAHEVSNQGLSEPKTVR